MPTLNWIGKEAVVKHHKEVPFRLLEPVTELSCGPADSGNLIVQGDNLHALKALLPRYAGQVKCIYIDPPYNTGNEGWVYNDNVNSPEIRRWLGEVVGKEGETLDRHDRWLAMMYPRLVLLKQFLREDGAIFVSIDDNEVGNLQALMREVFGATNEVATIVWEKGKKGDSKLVSVTHEYIVAFARNKALLKERKVSWRRRKPGIDAVLEHYERLRKKHGDNHAALRKEMMAWYRALPKGDPRKGHKHYNCGPTSAGSTSRRTLQALMTAARTARAIPFCTQSPSSPAPCHRPAGDGKRTPRKPRLPRTRHAFTSARITRRFQTARATCSRSTKNR